MLGEPLCHTGANNLCINVANAQVFLVITILIRRIIMDSAKFIVAGGSTVTLQIEGSITLTEAIKQVAAKAGVDLSNKDLRVNGQAASGDTVVSNGDRVVAASRPQGA